MAFIEKNLIEFMNFSIENGIKNGAKGTFQHQLAKARENEVDGKICSRDIV